MHNEYSPGHHDQSLGVPRRVVHLYDPNLFVCTTFNVHLNDLNWSIKTSLIGPFIRPNLVSTAWRTRVDLMGRFERPQLVHSYDLMWCAQGGEHESITSLGAAIDTWSPRCEH